MAEKQHRHSGARDGEDASRDEADLILEYHDKKSTYVNLCDEVEYILQKRLEEGGIRLAALTARAKELESFLDKIDRMAYNEPFLQMTDLAGVRVVCLYQSDLPRIGELIAGEFEVSGVEDKIQEQGAAEFGYGGVHYLVTLGKRSSGARYDDLKGLTCEIQVRTVVQDAWATIDHHLEYKQESAVPTELRRRLHAVSALFEIADREFDGLRRERDAYIERIREEAAADEVATFLAGELNLDSLREYVQWKFSYLPAEEKKNSLAITLEGLTRAGYKTLADVDSLVQTTWAGLELVRKENPSHFDAADLLLDVALALTSEEYGQLSSRWLRRKELVKAAKAIGDVEGIAVPPTAPLADNAGASSE